MFVDWSVSGPSEEHQAGPPPMVEKYKVYGLADDIKPGVSNMSEFAVVDSRISTEGRVFWVPSVGGDEPCGAAHGNVCSFISGFRHQNHSKTKK